MNRSDNYKKLINCQRWVKLRAEKLQNNPLCEYCLANGIITPGREIHHIVPIDTGINQTEMERLAYKYNNLITLCHKCHVQVHVELKSKTAKVIQLKNKAKSEGFFNEFLTKK